MAISYPTECDSPRRRIEYLFALMEVLRHVHNLMSYWYHNPITQVQYDNPPLPDVPLPLRPVVRTAFTFLKNKYPFKVQLTDADWKEFDQVDYMPRLHKICTQIAIQKNDLKNSTTYNVSIDI